MGTAHPDHFAEPEQYHIKSMSVQRDANRNHHSNRAMSYHLLSEVSFFLPGEKNRLFVLSHRWQTGSRFSETASISLILLDRGDGQEFFCLEIQEKGRES